MHARLTFLLTLFCVSPGVSADLVDDLVFEHGIAFFGELKYPSDFEHFDYVNPDAPQGGKLVLTTSMPFDTLAPVTITGIGAPDGYGYRSDTLVVRSGDEVSAFYGRLADGMAVTEDERTLVFRIHPDARWDDGEPTTARDVAFTFELQKQQVGASYFFRFIESIEVLDERHVAFHLIAPLTLDHVTLIQYIPILPEHFWRSRDPTAHRLEPPVSSGPYRVASLKAGRYIEYERNPGYWGRDIPVNRGWYNFDAVRIEVYQDNTVAREAFRKGLIDILDEEEIRYWATAYDGVALEKGWIRKIRRNYGLEVGMGRAVLLNSRVPSLADSRVRKALVLAFNFEWMNEALYHGQRRRAESHWPDTILAATSLPSDDELALLSEFRGSLPPVLFERPFQLPDTGPPDSLRRNLIEAKDLLASAGWRVRDGTLRNDDGEAFAFEVLAFDPASSRILLPWFQVLERLGIEATIRVVDVSQYANRLRYHQYDSLVQDHTFLMPPTLEVRAHFHSSAAGVEGSRNYLGVNMPVVDALVEAVEGATTRDELVAACRALDRVLLWHYYLIPLYAVDPRRSVYWDKFSRPPEPLYRPAFPDGWWYDEEKAARIEVQR